MKEVVLDHREISLPDLLRRYEEVLGRPVRTAGLDLRHIMLRLVSTEPVSPDEALVLIRDTIAMAGYELVDKAGLAVVRPRLDKNPHLERGVLGNVHERKFEAAPQETLDAYHSLNANARREFRNWLDKFYRDHPELSGTRERIPFVNQALEAAAGRGDWPK